MTMILLQFLLLFLSKTVQSAEKYNISLPGCPDNCNGIPIPYPFGIGDGCSLSSDFNVTCGHDSVTPPSSLYVDDSLTIMNINIRLGQVRFNMPIQGSLCYNNTLKEKTDWVSLSYDWASYIISNEKNKFVVTGCNTFASLTINYKTGYSVGCLSTCPDNLSLETYGPSCSGIGCCQTAFPFPTEALVITFNDLDRYNKIPVHNFSPCSYAMVVESDGFQFNTDLVTSNDMFLDRRMPIIFDWVVANTTCKVAQANQSTFACKSNNSVCSNYKNGLGHRCNCSEGYEGNPYLEGGCHDIDECATGNPCPGQAKCHNLQGTYECSPPKCHFGRRSKSNDTCELNLPLIIGMTIMLGFITSIIVLLLFISISKHIKLFEKRKQEKLKHKFFIQNRGLLLQQLIYSQEDTAQKMRIFRLDELEKATNKFDEALILGRGGHGEVYKGILSDQRIVAIKRSKIVDQGEIDQFINELVILSQINHRNVVKLYGCCLETEVPLLVYEFISNGTLYNHVHVGESCSLTWKQRLRIGVEVARAISYLHSSASISIFHRDIKSVNILLDDYFTAKLSDFGASRSVQIDQTGVTTVIQGTYGYLDPEYYYTGRLSQKSDVYSFGVILAELLTRQKPVFSSSSFEGSSLVEYFRSTMKEHRLFEILDSQIVGKGNTEEIEAVSKLAEMCLRMKGEERPTIKEVEVCLENLWQITNEQQKHPWMTSQGLELRKPELLSDYNPGINTTRQYSFEQELQSSSTFHR